MRLALDCAKLPILSLLSFLLCTSVIAGAKDYWVAPVSIICLAQYKDLWGTPMGTELATHEQFVSIVSLVKSPEAVSCLESRQWLPRDLCTKLLSRKTTAKTSLAPLYSSYRKDIFRLNELFACVNASTEGQNQPALEQWRKAQELLPR